MSKVTVVGAGNVGATCANVLVTCQIADEVVLLDIKEGVSEGKAMDIMQTANNPRSPEPSDRCDKRLRKKQPTATLW